MKRIIHYMDQRYLSGMLIDAEEQEVKRDSGE